MAANHGAVQSLPSFAQTFSGAHVPVSTSLRLPPLDTQRDKKRACPGLVHIKEEHDDDTSSGAPPPSSVRPPSKRRRVTISGAPHPLNTDVASPPADPASPTPISPVVMGFTVTRDNPTAIEKVKNMISVKQKQKALIEQRRGSLAGLDPVPAPRPPPPPPPPPPPISFARRRAEQLGSSAKKKPADILISPRDDLLQPAIQSAPPVPHLSTRFPMALPRLPSVMATTDNNVRRVATAVPPTPTRLAIHRTPSLHPPPPQLPSTSAPSRSPPAASVPIASTLVPPTPGLFHHPGYTGDKAAFLAPFEVFYDALNDAKQLKSWLADQLARSNALIQQHDKFAEVLDALVDKQVAPIRTEMQGLQRRVEELEDALRLATRRQSVDHTAKQQQQQQQQQHHKGSRTPLRNGIASSPMPMPVDSYTFPPAPPSLEPSSSSSRRHHAHSSPPPPIWGQQPHPHPHPQETPDVEMAESPNPHEPLAPRRIEPSRSLPLEPPPLSVPPQRLSPRAPFDSPKSRPKAPAERPSLSRQPSGHSVGAVERESVHSPPATHRRVESRRDSVVVSPPDAPSEA